MKINISGKKKIANENEEEDGEVKGESFLTSKTKNALYQQEEGLFFEESGRRMKKRWEGDVWWWEDGEGKKNLFSALCVGVTVWKRKRERVKEKKMRVDVC